MSNESKAQRVPLQLEVVDKMKSRILKMEMNKYITLGNYSDL